jgi:hypothetical protein
LEISLYEAEHAVGLLDNTIDVVVPGQLLVYVDA